MKSSRPRLSAPLALLAPLIAATAARGAAEADLVVGYDQSYVSSNGSVANSQVIIANAVAGNNAVQDRSGTGERVRIAGYLQVAQSLYQATSNGGFVSWMSSYDSRLSDLVDAGNARGADLVTFICESTSDGAAAVAEQPGRYSSFDPSAFWSTVVAHELGGHNYGCDHRDGHENPKTVMLHNYCGGGAQGYFSNPNIWLNGVKLVGGDSCLGTGVAGGDNAYLISTTAQSVADRYARVITAPSLGNVVRRWVFNRTAGSAAAGTTVTDSVSGTALATVQGTGATFTGTGLRLPGGASGSGAAYVALPAGVLSGYTNVTLEIWATPLSAPNWSRLFDFNNGTTNYMMLALSKGTSISDQRFESMTGGTAVSRDSAIATVAGLLNHYAITFTNNGSGGGRWVWYRNGDEVAYLDVTTTLASLQDVNAWLGRSAYSGDSFANCEYSEVRISSVAMTRDQVAANYRLGPAWQGANVTLGGNDPLGQASFNSTGLWSDGQAPSAGKSYETYGYQLRTPADSVSRTFAGQSLGVTGGGIVYKGTSSSTTTFNALTLAGDCELVQAGSGTWTLAGNVAVTSDEAIIRAANGPINLSAGLSGIGQLLLVNNTVTLSGTNSAFTGKTVVGDGRFSGLAIDSEARLGANPATFTADQLTLNRGILYTTTDTTIDDSNRGIRVGVSAALFNVASGATLTLAVPLSSAASGATLQTAPLYPNPVAGMLIKDNSGTLVLTHANNSHAGDIVINAGGLTLSGAGRLNNGDQAQPVTNNGVLTIATTATQVISGAISGTGSLVKNNTGILTLKGANTFTGAVTINGGILYANATNAANNRALSGVSGITVNSGGTLRSTANALFGSDGTQEKPITVNTGAILTAEGGSTGDVGVGTVTLAGGTLASVLASPAYGSWRFDNATDRLLVTQNSTASAVNVKFGDAGAAIDVSTGTTLNFTGTVTDATSGGISYLTKAGAGTLTLAGTNTYTGATAINAGVVNLSGSLAAGSAVAVASGATLTGTGTVNGALGFASGAIHAPGNPTGVQTVGGALSYASGAHLRWSLPASSAATNSANRVAAGAVNVTAGAVIDLVFNPSGGTVNFTDAFWSQSRSWTVMSASNKTGTFALGSVSADSGGRPVSDYGTLSLQQDQTSVTLVFTPNSPAVAWRIAHFGSNWASLPAAADDADPDGDGVSNLLERAFASDPLVAETGILPATDATAPMLSLLYRRAKAATDLVFEVQESVDLSAAWTAAAGSESVIEDHADYELVRHTRPIDADVRLFLRVKVTQP